MSSGVIIDIIIDIIIGIGIVTAASFCFALIIGRLCSMTGEGHGG